jgi:hypothetical protein
MRRIILQLLAIFITTNAFSQVINIESLRMHTDDDKFVLKNNLRFSYNSNNGLENYFISNSLGTQLKSSDLNKIYLFLADYKVLRSEGQTLQNSWYLHFRFNNKLDKLFNTKSIRFEAFAQHQYNENLIINTRNLAGAGLRFKVISRENEDANKKIKETENYSHDDLKSTMRLYFGYAYMYEEEKSDAFDKHFTNQRNSTYLSFNFVFPNGIKMINTIYYQPLFRDFGDYRISEEFQLSIKLTESLDLTGNFSYYLDSVTPQGMKDKASNLSLGLGLTL